MKISWPVPETWRSIEAPAELCSHSPPSRELARTTRNEQFVRVLEGLWSLDIGRQLLARRSVDPGWQEDDANEHRAILVAVAAREADRAADLMDRHIALTQQHWSKKANAEDAGLLHGEET